MFTLTWILENLYFTISMLLCSIFAGCRMPRRKYFILKLTLCTSFLIGEVLAFRAITYAAGINIFSPIGLFTYLFQYITVILIMWICFDCNIWAAVFCATVGYCLEHASERLYEITKNYYSLRSLHILLRGLIRTVILTAFCTLTYFSIIRRNRKNFSNIMVDNKLQIIAAVCLVAVIIFVNSFAMMEALKYRAWTVLNYIHILSAIFAFVGIIMEYSMSSNKHSETELKIMKQILRDEKERYEREKENIDLINIKCHDLRHQIAVYENKLEKEEIKNISEIIKIYDSDIKTGNDALDMILNEKSLICRKFGIKLTCLLDGRRLDFISAHEIYSLMGNAIENSINAVKELEQEKRIISITDSGREKLINIIIENYFDGSILFENGIPVTKNNPDYHGYGMKSMRYITENYGGALRSYVTGDIFRLEIFLPAGDISRNKGLQSTSV